MKTGTVIKTFNSKDGRKVVFRTLRWEDLDDLTEMINSLIDEGADIVLNEKVTKENETDWLARKLAEIEKGETLMIVAEVDEKAVASIELRMKKGCSMHVGDIGLGIRKGYQNVGIGTEMLRTVISHAEKLGLKMLTLTVFSTNKRARHVYEKVGFRETGRIPNYFYKNEQLTDEIIMIKELTKELISI